MNANETVRDVCAECEAVEVWDFPDGPMTYARRFLAAHEREMAAKDAEIARLKEALKPFVSLMDWMLKNADRLNVLDMVPKIREHGDRARQLVGDDNRVAKAVKESEATR